MCSIMGFTKRTQSPEEIKPYFDRTRSRGSDISRMEKVGDGLLCYHRLANYGESGV